MVLNYKGRHVINNWTDINYLQYVQSRRGLHSPSMLRAGYPTLLHWQQVVTTRSPRIITECLLTRSMLIKMYVHAIYSWFCIETILSNRKHEYEFITTITIKFEESFRSLQSSSDFLMLNTLVLFTYLDVCARLSISDLRHSSHRRTLLIGRGPHPAMIPKSWGSLD